MKSDVALEHKDSTCKMKVGMNLSDPFFKSFRE